MSRENFIRGIIVALLVGAALGALIFPRQTAIQCYKNGTKVTLGDQEYIVVECGSEMQNSSITICTYSPE